MMIKYDIITGIFKPPYPHDLAGQRFKFIAMYVRDYGKYKGQWDFEFYETDSGFRMLHHEYLTTCIPQAHIERID